MSTSCHVPVLTEEVLEALRADKQGNTHLNISSNPEEISPKLKYFLDCTFGGGGHSRAILNAAEDNYLIACDRNDMTSKFAKSIEQEFPDRFKFINSSFSNLASQLKLNNCTQKFDGILADLGLSSDQLAAELGFSFSDTNNLDMRMDQNQALTAEQVVNTYSEQQLVKIFKVGGAEQGARIVAQKIIDKRPFSAAKPLADVIASAVPNRFHKPGRNPATVYFQAIRIEVNQEFKEIKDLLELVPNIIKPHGRVAIISFHSLEDKCVTQVLRHWEQGESLPALHPQARQALGGKGRLLTKKAIVAGSAECSANPRSRSALMRVFEFN